MLIAHPSPDLYGSDLQLVETVKGLGARGATVVVVMPEHGPLTRKLEKAGAQVLIKPFPVLRKSSLRLFGVLTLAFDHLASFAGARRLAVTVDPDVLFVNTVTIPFWLVVAKILRIPSICHVHEAEEERRPLIVKTLLAPLLLAGSIVTNSNAATRVLVDMHPRLGRRTTRIYNGVVGRASEPHNYRHAEKSVELIFVGRISPRKGPDILIKAVGLLWSRGYEVHLAIKGAIYPGYEWYEAELVSLCNSSGLAEVVNFCGYSTDPFGNIPMNAIAVVPSRAEPFGNVAVEAQLAGLPVVVSGVQGLAEIVTHGETGLHFQPEDPESLAEKIAWLVDNPEERSALARSGRLSAESRFGIERYRKEISALVELQAKGRCFGAS
ncbi:glycosyltransferase family 4 protein [Gordonia amicalis]|uniref:glycosyltransferase family 4 protein n=1 Tax=Gordonia amicalis TaxID=89053 RepID=UPI002953F9A4|nr:glycosyltransferase family 4 protein [Gordonia amicalis]